MATSSISTVFSVYSVCRYSRDFYINTDEDQNEVSHLRKHFYGDLEKSIVHSDIDHLAFRAQHSTPHFTKNPMFDDSDLDSLPLRENRSSPSSKNVNSLESGYASSADSVSGERLALPKPVVVETHFETLRSLRQNNTLSLRSHKKRKMFHNYGSLRLFKSPSLNW